MTDVTDQELTAQTPEQFYSESTRQALAEASRHLAERLAAHTEALLAMTGGVNEQNALYEQNAALEELVGGWNEAVFEHTGTAPLLLEDEPDDETESLEPEQLISVVSRFDLRVVDLEVLLAAGRAAQERRPVEEDELDARDPVGTAEQAVDEISRELGEAWFELPGVDLVAGARAYVVPEHPFEPLAPDADDVLTELGAPNGTVTHAETWA